MILHNNPTASISGGSSTLSKPNWEENGRLKTFDYCVSNPPFSLKSWSNGVNIAKDPYNRFSDYGTPPDKNGDYAFLLHIVKSLKSKGKGAVILPHGVLFRGNAEAEIRKNIIQKGYIKGIIGLPANLFYGTGIPACIIVIDKENAHARKGIFMIDAGKGFIKDGNKNRLRDQDIHKIVDVFNKQLEVPKYSRMVLLDEIADAKNDYNLNIPRYIDSQEAEDIQDIKAHLLGGIPNRDIDALQEYWKVYPNLRTTLFEKHSDGYSQLTIDAANVKQAIFSHREFVAFQNEMNAIFVKWKTEMSQTLQNLTEGCKPKSIINTIAETILNTYSNRALIDCYDVYQHLMSYWSEIMQDDVYVIATDGWKAGNEVTRLFKETKGKRKDIDGLEGLEGKLIPPNLLIAHYFDAEQKALEGLQLFKETTLATKTELEEEHGVEGGLFGELDKINKVEVTKLLKEKKAEKAPKEEIDICEQYLKLLEQESKINAELKVVLKDLESKVVAQYPELTETEIKTLVAEHKWMQTIETAITTEMDRVSQALTQRIKELADRYDQPIPVILNKVTTLEEKVNQHLQKMGFVWS